MGMFSFLPRIPRCCWCTRNLKCASIFIICWSWFAATHEITMTLYPACPLQYEEGTLGTILNAYRWLLFIANISILTSGFAFLIGIFLNKPITGVIFIICGLVVAIFSFIYAMMLFGVVFKCKDGNDLVLFLIYVGLWCYFLLIINTFNETANEKSPL